MNLFHDYVRYETRRQFFRRGGNILGAAALATLLGQDKSARAGESVGVVRPHFPPKAKQVIYLHMVGGPPQMDLYDYKPQMRAWYDKDLPESIRNGPQRGE